MADVRTDPQTGTEFRGGGGQYPDYELAGPTGNSFYGRYESEREFNYYEAEPQDLRYRGGA